MPGHTGGYFQPGCISGNRIDISLSRHAYHDTNTLKNYGHFVLLHHIDKMSINTDYFDGLPVFRLSQLISNTLGTIFEKLEAVFTGFHDAEPHVPQA